MFNILGVFVNGRWRPGIGDPTVMGWVTVAAYLCAAGLCWACAVRFVRSHAPDRARVDGVLWWILAVVMLLLAVNKQLDLQSLFTQIGKDAARAQGWYDQRRNIQKWFIVAIAGSGLLLFAGTIYALRRTWRKHWLALLGIAFLISFIIMRAASFHHFDRFLKSEFAGFKMNWVFELGAILCITISALLNLRRLNRIENPFRSA